MNIFVFGDSIANGAFDTECSGWVDRLKRYVYALAIETDWQRGGSVHNYSIDGGSSSDMITFVKHVSERIVGTDIAILAVGANDASYSSEGSPVVSADNFNKNISNSIGYLKVKTSQVFIVGLTRVDEKKNFLFHSDRSEGRVSNQLLEQYDQILEQVALEQEIPYLEVKDLANPQDSVDGDHPDTRGHERIFLHVKDVLESKKFL